MDENLKELIPDEGLYNSYIQRQMVKGWKDLAIIGKLYEKRSPLLMVGPTGVGKTHAIFAFGAFKQVPIKALNLNGQTTVEDLVGQWVPGSDGKFVWKDGILVRFMKHGGIIVMDEVNGANAEQLFVLHSVTDFRRALTIPQHDGETIIAHEDFWIVGAMNPNYEGTRPLNTALKSRFVKVEFDYDQKVESKLITNSKLLEIAEKLRAMHKSREILTTISTRDLIYFQQNEELINLDFAIHSFLAGAEETDQEPIREVIRVHLFKSKQDEEPSTEESNSPF